MPKMCVCETIYKLQSYIQTQNKNIPPIKKILGYAPATYAVCLEVYIPVL